MIKVALIGYGYWGKNLLRVFTQSSNCEILWVADTDAQRITNLPFRTTTNTTDVFSDKEVQAVIIATPVSTHYELALQALQAGKHVLIEKPFTTSYELASELITLAENQQLIMMSDYVFLYSEPVQYIKKQLQKKELGQIQYIDSTRINLGIFQHDVNVLWDLASHDIAISLYLLEEMPESVQAVGISHTPNQIENIAYLTLHFPNQKIVHINCSWASPVKIRQMLIGGDKKMIVWNDLETSEKVKVYDSGFEMKSDEDRTKYLIDYRVGDIHIPKLNPVEPLASMASDFINSICSKEKPLSNSLLALQVLCILEAASTSLKEQGRRIKITETYATTEYRK